jgi:hypothetical protein
MKTQMKTHMQNGIIRLIRPLIWLSYRGRVFDTENTGVLNELIPNPLAPYDHNRCGKYEYDMLFNQQVDLARLMGKFKAIPTESFRPQERREIEEMVSYQCLVEEVVRDFSVISPSPYMIN